MRCTSVALSHRRVLGADSSPLCGEVAAILEKDNAVYVCGASLIDESWVLTAAHCVEKFIRSIQLLKVRLGEHDVSTTDEPTEHEERNVAQSQNCGPEVDVPGLCIMRQYALRKISPVVVHPNFDNKTLVNDLALVRLEKAARRRSNIDIVCVPSDQLPLSRNKTCYVTGWGKQTEDSNHSVVLKEIPVPLWENQACEKALRTSFGARFSLPPTAVCAGAEGRDACDGDGGGPLVCEDRGRWFQVGIVSFGVGCGRADVPGVYTRVSFYQNWLHDVVIQNRRNKA
ncbi:hypothetical protein J6590_087703 [Homalodisca vitripennis]|nr:hypothetical protein J6590_087703 [Homalodisca vitripennis]